VRWIFRIRLAALEERHGREPPPRRPDHPVSYGHGLAVRRRWIAAGSHGGFPSWRDSTPVETVLADGRARILAGATVADGIRFTSAVLAAGAARLAGGGEGLRGTRGWSWDCPTGSARGFDYSGSCGAPGETLIISRRKRTIVEETEFSVKEVEKLATRVYDNRDIGAAPASGSFKTAGMVIMPCSIKTASALATSTGDSLLCRAGDVTLKEGRPLIVGVREAPLHVGHLRQLTTLAEIGAIIFPPVPAFYHRPKTLDDIVNHTVGRILDRIRMPQDLIREWAGTQAPPAKSS
jgi:4-hydroxy-3-polyprenylbenzoate decarboxylase